MMKTKSKVITKPMLSMVVLGLLVMCSVTSAQASWTNGYSTVGEQETIQTTQTTVPHGEKDLSELGIRIKDRLGEVFQEVLGLVADGVKQIDTPVETQEKLVQTREDFIDISGNPFAPAIRRLADLGIINTQSQKFYPDNYLRNYEVIIMLVNALLYTRGETLNLDLLAAQDTSYSDLDMKASYVPWVKYAEKHDLVTYLTVTKRGDNFFSPNKFISKHEVYHILAQGTDLAMTYDEANADQQRMTRGEFASLLVQAFELQAPSPETTSPADPASLLMEIRTLLSRLD